MTLSKRISNILEYGNSKHYKREVSFKDLNVNDLYQVNDFFKSLDKSLPSVDNVISNVVVIKGSKKVLSINVEYTGNASRQDIDSEFNKYFGL